MTTCRRCATVFEPLRGIASHALGYCTDACRFDWVWHVCERCRVEFTGTKRPISHCKACRKELRRESERVRDRARRKARVPKPTANPARGGEGDVPGDLPAERIEAIIKACNDERRRTRSWLRIEDPWAQRPGAGLHNHEWAGL